MTDTQRNPVAFSASFKPIPTNPTLTVSTTSILADYYSQNSTLYLTTEETHEPSTNSDAIPFTKEQLEHLYKLVQSPKLPFVQKGNPLVIAFFGVPNSIHSWLIDYGAIDHMTGCSKMFSSYSPFVGNKKVILSDGSLSTIVGMGTIKITSLITLKDVLHVPNLSCNLLSISKFTSNHQCQDNFYSSYCEFQNLTTGRMIGSAKEKDGLYYFDDGPGLSRQFQSTSVNSVSISKENDIMLWYYWLGHPNFQYLKYLFPNLFKNKSPSSF